jgi:hypothetical protein
MRCKSCRRPLPVAMRRAAFAGTAAAIDTAVVEVLQDSIDSRAAKQAGSRQAAGRQHSSPRDDWHESHQNQCGASARSARSQTLAPAVQTFNNAQ